MWWRAVVAAYSAAEGKIAVATVARRVLGRRPRKAELEDANRACNDFASWPCEAGFTFDLEQGADAADGRGVVVPFPRRDR